MRHLIGDPDEVVRDDEPRRVQIGRQQKGVAVPRPLCHDAQNAQPLERQRLCRALTSFLRAVGICGAGQTSTSQRRVCTVSASIVDIAGAGYRPGRAAAGGLHDVAFMMPRVLQFRDRLRWSVRRPASTSGSSPCSGGSLASHSAPGRRTRCRERPTSWASTGAGRCVEQRAEAPAIRALRGVSGTPPGGKKAARQVHGP